MSRLAVDPEVELAAEGERLRGNSASSCLSSNSRREAVPRSRGSEALDRFFARPVGESLFHKPPNELVERGEWKFRLCDLRSAARHSCRSRRRASQRRRPASLRGEDAAMQKSTEDTLSSEEPRA